ncbi:uncharacterized protein LOC117647966 [Thrips palmi]|uniref:Uncharacterized protein LOC117647966 n=1 Tax=Thrips palmi TaxID=161013 RepID=A0A6P8Z6M0_THRPL|nr:uncharacterized protein LOC117647966 [Thrips palmi]
MAEDRTTVAGLTLPPKVVGDVSGHLVMKVDEVLWARKPPGEVSAVVLWWGGEEPTTFRPTDVAQETIRKRNTGVIYEIRTSPALFEKYLHKCGSLEIAMADKYGMPIGCVSVPNLWQMFGSCPYQGYYPIVNNFGNRIGDLHVSFNLRMSASIDPKSTSYKNSVKTKVLQKPTSVKQSQFSKEAKTKSNEKVVNETISKREVSSVSAQKCDSNDDYFVNVESLDSVQNRVSPTSNIISQILEHGTRLRDAMTASVMEDGVPLDLKSIPNFNLLSSDILKDVRVPQTLDTLPTNQLGPSHQNSGVKKISPVSEKKVLDYLSGKPMSSMEEEEALSALRNITPTKDILESVVPDIYGESKVRLELQESPKSRENMPEDSAETNEINAPINGNECSFEVDSQLLSQVNCLRVTVHSLVLNSVGIKRIGNAPKKKSSASHSNISLQPPGVTYFVEYKFPLVPESRSWESDVRYCSKRFNGHEVTFGDRTVHNIPETWRCSLPEETNLCSLISALSFKVCARHLHQRVPVYLGSAAPNSAKELVNSLHLRHDFDLPVIATDCLPVAQLKICFELGRDRIHFGGLLDPENNSLGIRSPRKTSSASKKSQVSLKNASNKKAGRSVTTVTRNIHSKHSSVYKWKSGVPRQVSQADQVIKRLVAQANNASKPSHLSDSSSAQSSARPKLKSHSSSLSTKDQSLAYVPSSKSSLPKQHANVQDTGQLLKHELAVAIIQVIDSNYLKSSVAEDRSFYISYKFPVSNTLKNDFVDWNTCSTEPSEGADGTWQKSQNKIHTAVLPKHKAFHVFLEQAFKLQGMQKRACVVFTLNLRTYGEEVKDFMVAEAFLPLTCMLTLEDAYNDASKNSANFSQSSCSSVVLDLPFQDLSKQCQKPTENSGSLRLKLDYRHSVVNLMQKGHLPRSRGDSITENLPSYDLVETRFQKQKPEIDVVLSESFDLSTTVPNWAKDKKFPSSQLDDTFLIGKKVRPESYCTEGIRQNNTNSSPRNIHASWEPVDERTARSRIPSRMSDSAYQLSPSCNSENNQSIADMIDMTKGMSQCALNKNSHSVNVSSRPLRVEDSFDRATPRNASFTSQGKMKKVVDAVTSTSPSLQHNHTSSRGTSPIASSKLVSKISDCVHTATSTEKVSARDKSQQVIIESTSQGSQTTPRERKETSQRDVGTSADLPGNQNGERSPSKSEFTTIVLPQRSIDDVETLEIVSEQGSSSGTSVHKEFSVETSTASKEVVFVKEVAQDITNETSNFAPSSFQAKIGVECALHLQTRSPPSESRGDQNDNSLVFVSINPCGVDGHISAHMGLNPVSISPSVEYNGEPEWHWETKVHLPVDLLVSTVKRLIFKLWLEEKAAHLKKNHQNSSATLLGFSAVDLTVLSAGLPFISGWYNVMDFSGACRGQIKLSVEPLESVSALVDSSSLIFTNDTQSNSPLSMFVAHCAYPDFPSHVTQFPDMRVQKVVPQPSDQAMSAVLSGYQLVRQHCSSSGSDHHTKTPEPVAGNSRLKSYTTLQREKDARVLEACPLDVSQQDVAPTETVSAPSASQPIAEALGSESSVEVEKDPSVLLREKLSELDSITRNIKARVLNRVESAKASGSPVPPFGVSLPECTHTHSGTAHNHVGGGGDEPEDSRRDECHVCACHQTANACSDDRSEPNKEKKLQKNSDAFGDHQSARPAPTSWNERNRAMQKQRRMWERHEDLIDFGTLSMEDEDEQPPHNEDVSEWLTEAALQQVFNPFLFNDILNSMNSSRGVQVIELDDTEDSDDNNDDEASAPHRATDDAGPDVHSNCQRWARRGDETYRKEAAHFPSNHIRSSTAACDADSGVDVDLSANFHPGSCRNTATRPEYYSSHLRDTMGTRTASSEREESSCSLSSRHQQSTVPSSASATPSDSPQHMPQRDIHQNTSQGTQGRKCSANYSNHRQRN